jgi:hypothetical protein
MFSTLQRFSVGLFEVAAFDLEFIVTPLQIHRQNTDSRFAGHRGFG